MGDINIDLLTGGSSDPLSDFFDAFGFAQVINEPTRVTKNSSTLLDPIFISNRDIVSSVGTRDANSTSDHRLAFCCLSLQVTRNQQKYVTYRDYKQFREDAFYWDLCSISWDDIYYMRNVDDKTNFFMLQLTSLFEKHVPVRTVRVNKPPAPWLTPALKALMKESDKAHTYFKKKIRVPQVGKFTESCAT